MHYLLFAMILWIQPLFAQKHIEIDKREARRAFEYLNAFRMNPQKHSRALGLPRIRNVKQTRLIWNNQLAKVAQARAYDMAKRNYFDHVDPKGYGPNYYIDKGGYHLNSAWLKKRSGNNFESIAANRENAVEGIKAFIIGKGSPGYYHRKHVLGLDPWNASLSDIGIGFVKVPRGSTYTTYLCVIIAKHDW